MAAVIKLALLAFVALMVLQLGWLVSQWLAGVVFGLPYLLWLAAIFVISLGVGIVVLIFRKRIWVRDSTVVELRELNQAAQKQFKQARARANVIDRNVLGVPWHLFLAMRHPNRSTVMAELGYVSFGDEVAHKGLVFTTWTSPTAVAYRIEIEPGADLSFDLLNIVLRHLFKFRPSMAINSAFVELELAGLMQTSAAETGNVSNINRILNVATYTFGIDVPVHVDIVGLEHMLDLARAALLTGHLNNGVMFGGFLSLDEPDLSKRIDLLFDDLVQSLTAAQFKALQKQLLPEFSAAILNAPFQMSLLQTQLRTRITSLTQPLPPRQKALNLQSIVFIGGRAGMAAVDPLSQVSGHRFFAAAPVTVDVEATQDSVTTENAGLVATAYHREGFLVAPNRRYSIQRSFTATFWSVLLATIVCLFAFIVWENYRAYSIVNDRLKTEFNTYFSMVGKITKDSDFLSQRIEMLQPLREGLQAYEPLDEQPYRRLLPNWSMAKMYQDLYDTELLDGLQASVIDFLEKEAFAYNTLADGLVSNIEEGVKLIELATFEDKIYRDQAANKQELINYYAEGLAEEGEVSAVFQSQLRATLDDLFTLNQPPKTRREDLRQVIAKTLEGMDTAELLYVSLMQRRLYAELIDLRQLIGPRFLEVFVPLESAETYLVPRAYTRTGFDLIFGDGEIAGLSEMITLYETVIGDLNNSTENAILRRVAQRYTSDYIASWSAFISELRLRDAEDWRDAQILVRALTNPSENPIERLVATLLNNTDLKVFLPPAVPVAPVEGAPAPAPTATEGPQLAPASFSLEAATAFNIRTAFRPYLDAMRAEGDRKNQFDLLLTYARDVNLWLEQAANAPNGVGEYLFEQYQKAESTNPLAVLHSFVTRSELGLINNLGVSVVTLLDESAMQFIYDYIDGEWQSQILDVYEADLTQAFPFNDTSISDIPLLKFADLFAPEGALKTFETTYLANFKTKDDQFTPRSTFLLGRNADLTTITKTAFARFGRISETMFVDGKPLLEFGLRVNFMSNELSKLTVSSGDTLLQFQHGPTVWTDQIWPVTGTQDGIIDLRVFQRSRPVINKKFNGPWSWFRLVAGGRATINPSRGYVDTTFPTDVMGEVILQFDSRGRHNPFGPQFFSGIKMPKSLFDRDAQPLEKGGKDGDVKIEILKRWLERDPIAKTILVTNKGRDLEKALRLEIQRFLKSTKDYTGQIDGIFGNLTVAALNSWRKVREDADK